MKVPTAVFLFMLVAIAGLSFTGPAVADDHPPTTVPLRPPAPNGDEECVWSEGVGPLPPLTVMRQRAVPNPDCKPVITTLSPRPSRDIAPQHTVSCVHAAVVNYVPPLWYVGGYTACNPAVDYLEINNWVWHQRPDGSYYLVTWWKSRCWQCGWLDSTKGRTFLSGRYVLETAHLIREDPHYDTWALHQRSFTVP